MIAVIIIASVGILIMVHILSISVSSNKKVRIKVKHIKTGNLYDIVIEEGKIKINGEWKSSITYMGKDKYTGKMCCFTREKEDFNNNFEYIE